MAKKYTKDYLIKLIKTVSSRAELKEMSPGAYIAVYKQGLSKELFSHLPKLISSKSARASSNLVYANLKESKKNTLSKIIKLYKSNEILTTQSLKKHYPMLYYYYYK